MSSDLELALARATALPAPNRVPAIQLTRFQLTSNYIMEHVTWQRVRSSYDRLMFDREWPPGLLGHIVNLYGEELRSTSIWIDEEHQYRFFTTTVTDMVIDSVNSPTRATDAEQSDYHAILLPLHWLVLGPQAASFVGARSGRPAADVGKAKIEPISFQLDFGCSRATLGAAIEELGYNDMVPEGSILQLVRGDGERLAGLQVWASSAAADAGLYGEFIPTLQKIAGQRGEALDLKLESTSTGILAFGAAEFFAQ